MFKKFRQQKELKIKMANQKRVCECGFPIFPPTGRTFNESILGTTQIYKEFKRICEKCGRENTIIG
jgi:hypothetical protein